jgi:signal peptide peptidase SppA
MTVKALIGVWMGTDEAALQFEAAANKVGRSSIPELLKMEHLDSLSLSSAPKMAATEADVQGYIGRVRYMAQLDGDVGIIDIKGVLTADYEPYNQYIGVVSYDEIAYAAHAMKVAAEIGVVKSVILRISSPGGEGSGIETADAALRALGKSVPMYTYAPKQMCSAAYWLGSHGKEIWAAKLAQIGSIGVVMYLRTVVKALEMNGVEMRVLREGEFKAQLGQYEEFDEEAVVRMQGQMRIMYDMFTGHVADQRGMKASDLKSGAGRGEVFLGVQAQKEKLVDKLGGFDALVKMLRTEYSPGKSGDTTPKVNANSGSEPMKLFSKNGKTYMLNEKGMALVGAGMSEEEAAEQEETLVEATEEQPAPVVEKTPEELAAEGLDADGRPIVAKVETPAPVVSAEAGTLDKIVALSSENGALKMQLANAQAALVTAQTDNVALKGVALKAINRMEIGMNAPVTKSADLESDSAVVAKFQKLEGQFNTMFKTGAKAEASSDTPIPLRGATPTGPSAVDSTVQCLTKLG